MSPKPATKPKRPLPETRDDLAERFKDFPGFQAWERAYESPDGLGSLPILLSDEQADACIDTGHQNSLKLGAGKCAICGKPARKWYLRHVNTKQAGRVAQIRGKGLIPVRLDEVRQKDEIADLHASADGLVHTGPSGARVLYKQPLDLYNLRKRKERDTRDSRRSTKHVREELANDAAGKLGDEAAETIGGSLMYSETAVRTTLQAEAGGGDDE